jgi:hypothetical protein
VPCSFEKPKPRPAAADELEPLASVEAAGSVLVDDLIAPQVDAQHVARGLRSPR